MSSSSLLISSESLQWTVVSVERWKRLLLLPPSNDSVRHDSLDCVGGKYEEKSGLTWDYHVWQNTNIQCAGVTVQCVSLVQVKASLTKCVCVRVCVRQVNFTIETYFREPHSCSGGWQTDGSDISYQHENLSHKNVNFFSYPVNTTVLTIVPAILLNLFCCVSVDYLKIRLLCKQIQ